MFVVREIFWVMVLNTVCDIVGNDDPVCVGSIRLSAIGYLSVLAVNGSKESLVAFHDAVGGNEVKFRN